MISGYTEILPKSMNLGVKTLQTVTCDVLPSLVWDLQTHLKIFEIKKDQYRNNPNEPNRKRQDGHQNQLRKKLIDRYMLRHVDLDSDL